MIAARGNKVGGGMESAEYRRNLIARLGRKSDSNNYVSKMVTAPLP